MSENVVTYRASPLEALYYAVAAASSTDQVDDVGPAWEVLQSYLEYDLAVGDTLL